MRFKTDFKLNYPDYNTSEVENCMAIAELGMGQKLSRSFGWKESMGSTFTGNSIVENKNWELDIEAFPTKEWINFKNALFAHLDFCEQADEMPDNLKVLKMIKELEFFRVTK